MATPAVGETTKTELNFVLNDLGIHPETFENPVWWFRKSGDIRDMVLGRLKEYWQNALGPVRQLDLALVSDNNLTADSYFSYGDGFWEKIGYVLLRRMYAYADQGVHVAIGEMIDPSRIENDFNWRGRGFKVTGFKPKEDPAPGHDAFTIVRSEISPENVLTKQVLIVNPRGVRLATGTNFITWKVSGEIDSSGTYASQEQLDSAPKLLEKTFGVSLENLALPRINIGQTLINAATHRLPLATEEMLPIKIAFNQ